MNKLILPKTYLSWSAMSCWISNPVRFRREYFECGRKLDTKYLRFGKGIAELIENNKYKELLPDLIVYKVREHEIRTTVNGIPILSFLDDYDPDNNVFREKKTGKIPWTKAKVIKHGQLLFYAVALKHSVGEMPEYCDLDWIQTKDVKAEPVDFWRENEKKVNITGIIKSFHRPFYEGEIERMEKLIVKSATEISEAYKSFLKEI